MPAKNNNRVEQLAVSVAAGTSIAMWCRKNSVPLRTAYGWASSREFKAQVADHRRQLTDRAIGKLAANVAEAVSQIRRLMREGQSETTRLGAAKAIISELIAIQTHAQLADRIEAMEKRIDEYTRIAGENFGARAAP
jgi:hypothetical protein